MTSHKLSPWRSGAAANDNTPPKGPKSHSQPEVKCNLPDCMGILEGEIDLVVRHWDDILMAANDNEPDTDG